MLPESRPQVPCPGPVLEVGETWRDLPLPLGATAVAPLTRTVEEPLPSRVARDVVPVEELPLLPALGELRCSPVRNFLGVEPSRSLVVHLPKVWGVPVGIARLRLRMDELGGSYQR